ncbi:MAG: hypothetical protein AAF571_07815 [Verrucomicrobiota bacterium]
MQIAKQAVTMVFCLAGLGWQSLAVTNGTSASYSSVVNDRFLSGYPSAPVRNTNGSFIGLGYEWSGVTWQPETTTSPFNPGASKSFGLISPKHHLIARHFGG